MSTCNSLSDNLLEDFLVRCFGTLEWSSADNGIKWLCHSIHMLTTFLANILQTGIGILRINSIN